MGIGFTIDAPIKVAKYGISSVISLVNDSLIEQLREYYSNLRNEKYLPIYNGLRFDSFLYAGKQKNIPLLGPGTHHVVVYANNNGIYTKVIDPKTFVLTTNYGSIFWSALGIIILWIITLGGYFTWRSKRTRRILPPEEGYNPSAK